jgi:hypothetical protein
MSSSTGPILTSRSVTRLCSRLPCRDIPCINSHGLIYSINLFTLTPESAGQSSTENRPPLRPADHSQSTYRDITSFYPIIPSPSDQGRRTSPVSTRLGIPFETSGRNYTSGTSGKTTDRWDSSHRVTYITTQDIEFPTTTSDTEPTVRVSTGSESHSLSPRVAALIFGTIAGAIVYVIVVSTIVRLFRVNSRPLSVTYNPNVSYFSSDSD